MSVVLKQELMTIAICLQAFRLREKHPSFHKRCYRKRKTRFRADCRLNRSAIHFHGGIGPVKSGFSPANQRSRLGRLAGLAKRLQTTLRENVLPAQVASEIALRCGLAQRRLCDLTQLSLRVGLYLHTALRDARHPVSTPSSIFRGLVRYCRTRTAGLRFHRL